jgi:argininosuccinate lyase
MWLESFHDALQDDILYIQVTKKIIDQNPLGSAA